MGITDEGMAEDLLETVRSGRPAGGHLRDTHSQLWLVTLLFFCVGDLVTTHAGLSLPGIVEAGPVVGPVLREYGLVAMLGLKGATVVLCYGLYRAVPEPQSLGVPLGMAALGVAVTGWNLVIILLGVT